MLVTCPSRCHCDVFFRVRSFLSIAVSCALRRRLLSIAGGDNRSDSCG